MFGYKKYHKRGKSYEQNHRYKAHIHTHGAIDPSVFTNKREIWVIKWSYFGLLATAIFQVVIVLLSGSVVLLADTIHLFHCGL